jgi:hypothetical protein
MKRGGAIQYAVEKRDVKMVGRTIGYGNRKGRYES